MLVALPATPQRSGDLDRIRTDITRLRKKLEEVRRQAESAARELEEVELELGIRTRELELATVADSRMTAEQEALALQVASLVERTAQQKTELRSRLVALYRMGGLSYVRMLLALEEQRNPLDAISMLSYLVSRDARLVDRFEQTQGELAGRRAALVASQERLRVARADVEQRREEVERARAEKAKVLAKLRIEESGTEKQLAVLEEKARRLQRLVDNLSQQKRGLDPEADIRGVQGALAWPVKGKVFERFGRQRNPKFATWTVNNGLKIEAVPGTEVRAVFQGPVLFSQWFKGYGNLIILDHGNRVFSLYGNLRQSTVAVGDRIATGQPIAGVGESEETASGHLYFEMRRDNKPEDPQKWLR
jgi:septal ring factor EnvC (AmiA/AmiB activator)